MPIPETDLPDAAILPKKKGTGWVWIRRFFNMILLFPFVFFITAWLWLIFSPPNLAAYIPTFSRYLSDRMGLDFYLGQMLVHPGFSFTLEGKTVRLSTPDRHDTVLDAEAILLRFSPLQWFRGWPAFSVVLDRPEFVVRRDAQGILFLGGYPAGRLLYPHTKPETNGIPLPIQHIALSGADISWVDEWPSAGKNPGVPLRLKRTDLALFFEPGGVIRLNLDGWIDQPDDSSPVQFTGQRTPDGSWSGRLEVDRLNLSVLRPYVGTSPPLGQLTSPIKTRLDYFWYASQQKFQCFWKFEIGKTNLDWTTLFRWPLPVKKLMADGSLTMKDDLWSLKVDKFHLENMDGQGEGYLSLDGLGGSAPTMDLSATVKGVPSNRAKVYYPATIMSSSLVKWLDQSLHGGNVDWATVHIKGPLKDIPFAKPPGKNEPETVFSIAGDVKGINLTFFPGLPDLSRSRALVSVDRLGITIQVPQASFGKNRNVGGQVRIADMVNYPIVEVEAHIPQADLESTWTQVVTNSKLQWDKKAGLEGMKINGRGEVKLSLLLPLENMENSWFSGTLDFNDTLLHPTFLDAPLEQARGHLDVDPAQLTLELSSGMLHDRRISLATEAWFDPVPGTPLLRGQIETIMNEGELNQWFSPLMGNEGGIRGEAPFLLSFTRKNKAEKFDVIAVLQAKKLGIDGGFAWSKPDTIDGSVRLEGQVGLGGDLDMESLQVELGNLFLTGSGKWHLRRGGGILDLSRFRLNDHRGELRIVKTDVSGQENWDIEAKMNWLNLAPVFAKETLQNRNRLEKIKPNIPWPRIRIQLHATDFKLANEVKGEQLDARLTIENNRVTLHHLKGQVKGVDHRMRGELLWPARLGSGPYDGYYHLESKDIGQLFRGFDIQDAFMQGGHARLDMSLDGFLPPGVKLKNHLSGAADFDLTRGTIARLGFLSQVLGLFSLKELPNLLFFDRPDLTANGFRYEKIQGKATLNRGVATLEGMVLDGPSMKMVLSGNVNFSQQQLDLLLGIRPIQTLDKIVSSVPVIGTLVAGNREAVLETLFDIEGSMDDPKVSIRPVASIIPGIVRDFLTQPDDPKKKSLENQNIETGESVP
ncbi:MAG: rane protein-like protein [Magnetococcales bacterium]|nr:rane protein-like protein [Magnetococcales bacterium]